MAEVRALDDPVTAQDPTAGDLLGALVESLDLRRHRLASTRRASA